ncbi:phosphotransferase [Verrucomicrobia bacterium]|jgi:RIO-like serine/threonine protein kinase|nr:phosphotransferase [Verrucomicrobiota bacterium]
MKILKEFKTISKSKVLLIQDENKIFVRKINNIDRNYEQMLALKKLGLLMPKILKKDSSVLDMEYIEGISMVNFFETSNPKLFTDFLCKLIDILSVHSEYFNYSLVYSKKLNEIKSFSDFIFSKEELLEKLPTRLPKSHYHGDLTLDNILYFNKNFYLIDCLTSDYSSWVFDFVKLRQDLECGWFLRSSSKKKFDCLDRIQKHLINRYPLLGNNYLLILMLLRIYNYTVDNETDRNFIVCKVNQLWK